MRLLTVRVEKPEAMDFVLGQTRFIKTVEDIHEALFGAVPGIKFGPAFGRRLVRWSGTDDAMIDLARSNAPAPGAGPSSLVFLGEGCYPLNVLNTLKLVPEVCRIVCATANPTEVVLVETDQGRGILGVVDGFPPGASRATWTSPGARASCARSATSPERRTPPCPPAPRAPSARWPCCCSPACRRPPTSPPPPAARTSSTDASTAPR